MKDYRGYKFITNKDIECLVVYNNFNDMYTVIGLDNYVVMANDTAENIVNLIDTIKNKF